MFACGTQDGPDPADFAAARRRRALRFVVTIGVVSLFADMTYEGARSINGQYLGLLGASAFWVSAIAGVGELLGYGLRIVSGFAADRSGRYWPIVIAGFVVNLLVVPLLALAGNWIAAGALMIGERIGKGIRTPARDAMLAHAGHSLGNGWAFGLHEALDQAGATIGPLLVTAVLIAQGGYRHAYALLLAPALASLAALALARATFPQPAEMESRAAATAPPTSRQFVLYLTGTSLVAAGFADYSLIAFHAHREHLLADGAIPALYALGMVAAAAGSLACGRWFDRAGIPALLATTALAALFAPCAFLGGAAWLAIGVALWGVGVGAHESVMRAVVARQFPAERRASAFGVFNTVYGVAWFAGSLLLGLAYEISMPALVATSMALQLAALPFLAAARTPAEGNPQ